MQWLVHACQTAGAWIQANPGWSAFIAVTVLTMIANSLGKYPKAAGFVGWVRKLIDLLQPWTHAESPGTWKPPLVTLRDGKLAWSFSPPPVLNGVNPPAGGGGAQ